MEPETSSRQPATRSRARSLRVAMIGPFGLSPKGTMRVRALPLAHALAARGHRVALIMPPWHTPAQPSHIWTEGEVRLEYVSLTPRLPLLSELAATLRLVRRALAWRPDVIHGFKPKGHAGLALWLLWRLRRLGLIRARLVVDEDDWEGPGGWNDREPYPPALRAFFAWQERWGLRHNEAVTVASRTLQSLAWGLGITPPRVHYVPNGSPSPRRGDGAPIRERHALGQAPVVLLYTRFFEYDVARAVAVFARVAAELPTARLLVVGQALFPEDDVRFDQLAAEAGLGERVTRAGWVRQEDLPDYFAAANVAFYPFDDTLINRAKCAVKLVDLLAAGVPVVADAVGQNTEYIVHQETGLLVPAGDIAAMSAALCGLLRDEPWRRRLGNAAAQRVVERYHWDVLVEEVLKAYGAP